MTASKREVNWGEGLRIAVTKRKGGLKAISKTIADEAGQIVGTRNTFAKLLKVTDPATLDDVDQYRAWLLLTALGENPTGWGISDSVVPKFVDTDALRDALGSYTAGDLNPEPADLGPTYIFGPKKGIRREPKPKIVPGPFEYGPFGPRQFGTVAA